MKNWEIIADNLSKAGCSLGWVSAVDSQGERSWLLTRIATTESVSSFTRMKSRLRVWNWKGLFVSTC